MTMLDAITPEALAKEMGWAPKRLRRLAKSLGACRVLGNRMALLPEDVRTIMEATKPCPSNYIAAKAVKFTTTTRGSTEKEYDDLLAQLSKKKPRKSRELNQATSNVLPMNRAQS